MIRDLAIALGAGLLAVITHPAGYMALVFMALCAMFGIRHIRDLSAWISSHVRLVIVVALLICAGMFAALFLEIDANYLHPWQLVRRTHSYDYNKLYLFFFRAQFGLLLAWALLGVVLGSIREPRTVIPLLLSISLFYVVIAWFSTLFHFRYALPIFLFLPSLVGFGIVALVQRMIKLRSRGRITCAVLASLLYIASHATARLSFSPRPYPDLGYTAPTAEWRGACEWIAKDHAAREPPGELITVSTFPMFHDFYLGQPGTKYFLPHSLSGFPGHDRNVDIHAGATAVEDAVELQSLHGAYLFIDSFGIRMLSNPAIKAYLTQIPPDHIAPGAWGFDVHVWRLPFRVRP
jgi:hypothetical protein